MRQKPSPPPPSPTAFFQFLKSLGLAFNPRQVVFLDRKGSWAKNPIDLRDRICHHFLFELWKKGEDSFRAGLEQGLPLLVDGKTWPLVQKVGYSEVEENASLLLFNTLLWIVERTVLQLNVNAFIPAWNQRDLVLREDFRKRLVSLEASLEEILSAEEKIRFLQAISRVEKASATFLEPLARLIADEEKIMTTIFWLLDEASFAADKAEAYGAIIERLHPPMGIVTTLPPALFLPALRLLLHPDINISSGIPYAASVTLSLFNDSRSTEALLEALERYPFACSKVRENIIYTLGNLGEERAVDAIARILDQPDELVTGDSSPEKKLCLIIEQKEEAIWALGKIGFPSARVLSSLVRYVDHPSARLKTYLAWTLGEIGRAQKEKTGGLSADLVIALLRLLKEKNKQVFEEAAASLKKIQMPEFLHSLYLYSAGAVSLLTLQPAQRGLNELSETVHYLLKTKNTVVVAVNGDSGTGKTYFCQAIANGFGDILPSQILYLMRDSKRGQKVFNRLLGLDWLKKHIDPAYYEDYPLPEEKDNPQAFFHQFLKENADKRLILLDGCRDRHYFQKVIDIFYQNAELDVEVNFRANFSTRRFNLEERERALESVKLHLAFLEEPALEDTPFYQEGLVILYDLDNSLGARLNQEETRQLFVASRVDNWGEYIRIGDFGGERHRQVCFREKLGLSKKGSVWSEAEWPESHRFPISFEEEILKPRLSAGLEAEPNLLMTILPEGLAPDRLRFYAQEQVAGTGRNGKAFVLTLVDNRLFKASVGMAIKEFSLLGRTFFLLSEDGRLVSLSFEKNEMAEFIAPDGRIVAIATWPPDSLITATEDGRFSIWNFAEKKNFRVSADLSPFSAIACDPSGKIYGWNQEGLWRYDYPRKELNRVCALDCPIRLMRSYPREKIVAVEAPGEASKPARLLLLDFRENSLVRMVIPLSGRITTAQFISDERILVGSCPTDYSHSSRLSTLAILTPDEDDCLVATLPGHGKQTLDCLPLGPRVITCGEEIDGASTIRLWGSPFYVRTTLAKLHLLWGRTTLTY